MECPCQEEDLASTGNLAVERPVLSVFSPMEGPVLRHSSLLHAQAAFGQRARPQTGWRPRGMPSRDRMATLEGAVQRFVKEERLGAEEVRKDIPREAAPKDGVFTLASLAEFDGKRLPVCLGICGKVFNVSSSATFRPNGEYGTLLGGKEATYAMAKSSLTLADANKLNFSLEDFSATERANLAGLYAYFTTAFPIVGTLKEYEGRDFSPIEAEAVTRDGLVGADGVHALVTAPASAPAPLAARASEPVPAG